MEPRPHERGKRRRACGLSSNQTGLQWSHVLTNVERPAHSTGAAGINSGFNGATSSRTWKVVPDVTETAPPAMASMEPRPHERGKRLAVGRAGHLVDASMEPRPHERGKRAFAGYVRRVFQLQWSHVLTNVERPTKAHEQIFLLRLQWSHVLTNVESHSNKARRNHLYRASMEPRPHERGKVFRAKVNAVSRWLQWSHVLTNVESRSRRTMENQIIASMEPRPHERGKTLIRLAMRAKGLLQWSHVLTNVERCARLRTIKSVRKLQWSHVLTNVESVMPVR